MQKIFLLILMLATMWLPSKAEIVGDSVVAIYNNWTVGDTMRYDVTSSESLVSDTDTIVVGTASSQVEIELLESVPEGDMVFRLEVKNPSLPTESYAPEMQPLMDRVLKVSTIPNELVTDYFGRLKDIRNYNDIVAEMDSCKFFLMDMLQSQGLSPEQTAKMTEGLETMFQNVLDKDVLLQNIDLFQCNGNVYDIGSWTFDTDLPAPMLGNMIIPANVTASCEVAKVTDDMQIVVLKFYSVFNSDKLIEGLKNLFMTDQQRAQTLTDAEEPYLHLTRSEEYVIEALRGIVGSYTREISSTYQPGITKISSVEYQLTD